MDCNWKIMGPPRLYRFAQRITGDSNNICNTFEVTSLGHLTVVCPNYYTVSPPDCFIKVYKYKRGVDSLNETLKMNEYRGVIINIFIRGKKLQTRKGDKGLQNGKLPEDVTQNVFFF